MSIKFINWAFQVEGLNPIQKVILIALADNSDDEGECFPSLTKLLVKTGVSSKTTIRSNLAKLESKGLLVISKRVRFNGSQTSNLYKLTGGSIIEGVGSSNGRGGGLLMVGGVGAEIVPLYEPPSEPSIETPLTIDQNDLEIKFQRFWERYPRKMGKKKAKALFAKLNFSDDDFWRGFMFGLTNFVTHCEMLKTETKFIKHPVTWLNGEHWNDELASANYGEPVKTYNAMRRAAATLKPKQPTMKVIN